MSAYVRPPLPSQVFHEADGTPFVYGERWGCGDPPEESYSRVSHPERFAPLHDVADALVEHLANTYDVQVREGDGPGENRGAVVRRACVLTPASAAAAPLTLLWTDHPSVVLRAGLLAEDISPACGCDACDEPLEAQVEDLEEYVLGVAAGHLTEWVRGRVTWVGFRLEAVDGHRSGESRSDMSSAAVRDARHRLAALPAGRWQPWPLKDRLTEP
ncbi:DUF6226 family protein [Georgenia halophila]|uniref:DUF6226 family protein n=1 Tax=Georgenia halophila TaxID=620889 RepID=UPI0031EF9C3C